MADSPQEAQVPTAADEVKAEDQAEEMCCAGDGTTAEQHRHESEDGKCCIDK